MTNPRSDEAGAQAAADATAARLLGERWSRAQLPSLEGRRALVTGGTRGLGREVAAALAARGAEVTITGTRAEAAAAAAAEMGAARGIGLDLADLDEVRAAAEAWEGPIHILVNNAGIMWGPHQTTPGGVERQLATNFLGHFALAGRLLPRLVDAHGARVVSVSSDFHRHGGLEAADLDPDPARYRPNRAYGTSKLAQLAFARELGRRAEAAGLAITSVAAHPGWASTGLQTGQLGPIRGALLTVANAVFAVPASRGAEPLIAAAGLPGLPSGVYLGPGPRGGRGGGPRVSGSIPAAHDPRLAEGLWSWAERASGVRWLSAE